MIRATLLAMLSGAHGANAVMPWGRPGPIRLPDDPSERAALVDAHLIGAPADVTYCPQDEEPERVHVEALALAAFCPDSAGQVRWLGIDLDGPDHGAQGLVDPAHAARCIAERAENAGLGSGLLTATSRGGQGRHVFLILPAPTTLADAVLGLAALVASAFRAASADVVNWSAAQAFRAASGGIAEPGQVGAVELVPRSTMAPPIGWAMALPAAGAFTSKGGGVVLDPFTGCPIELAAVPSCDPKNWARFVVDARAALPRKTPCQARSGRAIQRGALGGGVEDPLERLDARTRDFLAGRVPEGGRNRACFAAACNLIGCGVAEPEAERLILAGAAGCGLPEREGRTAFASAVAARRRRTRR